MSNRIVVVGGGFAGFWAAVAARRVAGAQIKVVLVSREPILQMRPRLYEADPERLYVDLPPILRKVGVDFVCGEATALDHLSRTLVLDRQDELRYARLVVATGSALRRPSIPGAGDAYSIDTVQEAIAFDKRLAEIARSSSPPTVAVIGAGFTGIELALELRDRLAHHGAREHAERARIILVDRASVVGAHLGIGPRGVIETALADARVEVLLHTSVTALAGDRLHVDGGRMFDVDAIVLTSGMVAAEFARRIPGDHDECGRIVVDQWLRASGAERIFVGGDAAAVDDGDGHIVLQSCQHALQLGRFAGENAARDLIGVPTIKYKQPEYVTCLDLGRYGAVFTRGWSREVELSGAEAKVIKRRINTEVIYPPADATGEDLLLMSNVDPALQRPPQSRGRSGANATGVSRF